ncbi:SulP family inorganic anion transporter [Bradyrhizobium sp. Arg816]|uniref:SulP family inorganic anion transporter n=1 Tax=Bradyrhizobium sp. Arg816 TaxID=2998491 RepID=UPI00249EB4D4|nr:SulP family inorganic anion transporter [Bradyrhizobium sp. Arg816]MDI3560637.1 SulP family inorganic anion transporter [Bradyrhizobium sp. Arg816]
MVARFIPSRGDLFGGLSAGVVALPLCLALGALSGLGPESGLYGAIVLGILASLFGGTPVLVSGPTAPMTLVSAGVVAASMLPNGEVNLAFVVAVFLLTGALQALFGLLRLGSYIRYVPYPVISGFMSGIGVLIFIQQIFPMAGMAAPSSEPAKILAKLHTLPAGFAWPAALMAAATLAIIYLLPRVTRAIPSSVVALVLVTAGSLLFGVDAPRIGAIPSGLPAFVVPEFDFTRVSFMVTTALELALLGAIDSLLSALLADNITKTHHASDRELIGQGIGNMAAALVGGLPGAGASIRTIVNIEAGGSTRLSGVVHGLFLLAVLLGLSGVVRYIPTAVLAGILVAAGLSCIDRRGLGHITKVPRADAALMLLVLVLTVFSGVIVAVAAGLVAASFVFMKNVADLSEQQTTIGPMADEPWADELSLPAADRDRLLVKHIEGPLFFGFARGFADIAQRAQGGKLLVLRMDRVRFMDQSGAYALVDALIDLKAAGLRILIVGLPVAQLDILKTLHLVPDVVPEKDLFHDFRSLKDVLPRILEETGSMRK